MKKTVLISLILILVNTVCFARNKTFRFDGISFEHSRGWKIKKAASSEGDGAVTITGTKTTKGFLGIGSSLYTLSISKYVENDNYNMGEFVQMVRERSEEEYAAPGSKTKFKSISEVRTKVINGIETKSFDMFYDFCFLGCTHYLMRQYFFKKDNQFIQIRLDGPDKEKKYDKQFSVIVNSFSFEPE